jgi:phosphoribosylanthranilate isomerase
MWYEISDILEVGSPPIIWDLYSGKKSTRYFDGIIPELPKSKSEFLFNESSSVILKVQKYNLQTIHHGHESVAFCSI